MSTLLHIFMPITQGDSALFSIATGQIIQGDFPRKQSAFVTAWAFKW